MCKDCVTKICPVTKTWPTLYMNIHRYWRFVIMNYRHTFCGSFRYLDAIYWCNNTFSFYLQCVQEKLYFFHNSLQHLPRLHRCNRPSTLSTQCECTVTLIGWYFFVQPIAAECWRRGRGGKLSRILGKKHNI